MACLRALCALRAWRAHMLGMKRRAWHVSKNWRALLSDVLGVLQNLVCLACFLSDLRGVLQNLVYLACLKFLIAILVWLTTKYF